MKIIREAPKRTATDHVRVDMKSIEIESDNVFLDRVVSRIEGWLDHYAALRTIDLLRFQETKNVAGSVYEVGIFHGKYFSILLRSAVLNGDRAIGIDSFEFVPYSQFMMEFSQYVPFYALSPGENPDIEFLVGVSTQWDGNAIFSFLKGNARFISIDGSHEHDDVLWDLQVADAVLDPRGIIAADDYLNHACLGVNEAINRFLMTTPRIVPFAYIANKLFLSRPEWADRYRAELERCIMADTTEQKSKFFQEMIGANGRRNVECTLFGRKCLTIPL